MQTKCKLAILIAICLLSCSCLAWTIPQTHRGVTALFAKRNKRQTSRQDADDLDRWYEQVDSTATPDDVFWQEMERQKLLAQVGSETKSQQTSWTNSKTESPWNPPASSTPSLKSVESTLIEYSAFCVYDNWLDEDLALQMMDDNESSDYMTPGRTLDEQLAEWEFGQEGQMDDDDDESEDDDDSDDDDDWGWMQSDEPWDHFGQTDDERKEQERLRLAVGNKAQGYLYDADNDNEYTLDDDDNGEAAEAAFWERISRITITSRRLEKARNNPKAKAFFERKPNEMEGFDRLWVAAIDNVCFKNLVGTFRNYGIEFADNFGDWKDVSLQDGLYTIEDVASYKARMVHNVTGLPCIAVRTSFEVEPVPDFSSLANNGMPPASPSARAMAATSPRVASGYRFNDVGVHVDYICEALRPVSEPSRVTRFKTCLCYYDGEMEVFTYGICDCDLVFAESTRTFIPVAQSIQEMIQTLQLTFGLEYQKWLRVRIDEARKLGPAGGGAASVKLRDRVLKEGRVLPNDIVDVSTFMDSQVDVNLMDECAKELANLFVETKPSKILTLATTGLVIALPMAKYLQVPVVYARKERNVVMADTYKATYTSKTVGQYRELLVSKSHIHADDRVLVIDDFLSSGSSQEALLRIVNEAGAKSVGVGVLLEKVYDSGRNFLSGFDIPIRSLCRIASVKDGVIQLVEEDGFDRMKISSTK
jgi:xanthine phosphoribosyltransferase